MAQRAVRVPAVNTTRTIFVLPAISIVQRGREKKAPKGQFGQTSQICSSSKMFVYSRTAHVVIFSRGVTRWFLLHAKHGKRA